MDEEQAREEYVTIQALRKQQRQFDQRLEELDDKMTEIQDMIATVEQAAGLSGGQEILVPLTNGVFLPATSAETKTIYLNVGGGVVIEKKPRQAIQLLGTQQQELEEYRKTLKQQAVKITSALDSAEKRAARQLEE